MSIILTQLNALALRHRLIDRLGGRSDILMPQSVSPTTAARLKRFLVAGLDYEGEPGIGGWPVPTGGRYVKLCFSPRRTERCRLS